MGPGWSVSVHVCVCSVYVVVYAIVGAFQPTAMSPLYSANLPHASRQMETTSGQT